MTSVGNLESDQIIFPGLGIDIHFDSDAFTIFGLTVKWYGVIIAFGLILAMLYGFSKMKKFGIDSNRAVDVIFAGMIGGIIGARTYYVLMEWDNYKGDWKNIFNIRNGGLAIYGGIIGAVLVGALFAKIRKVKFLPLLDIVAPCFLIGQCIGRWGNFANQEAFGYNTDLPWGMSGGKIQEAIIEMTAATGKTGLAGGMTLSEHYPVHPCFLYESLWCLIGFIIIALFIRLDKRKFDGQVFIMYTAWYGFGRFFIEGLRTDSLMLGNIRVSQALAAVCVVVSIALLAVFSQKVNRMGSDYVLYCDTEESKELLKLSEENYSRKEKDKEKLKKMDMSEEAIWDENDDKKDDENDVDDEDKMTDEDIWNDDKSEEKSDEDKKDND